MKKKTLCFQDFLKNKGNFRKGNINPVDDWAQVHVLNATHRGQMVNSTCWEGQFNLGPHL